MKPNIGAAMSLSRRCSTVCFWRSKLEPSRFYNYEAFKRGQRSYSTRFAYPEGMKPYEEDYSESPEYPEINAEQRHWLTPHKKWFQKRTEFANALRNCGTVEEKLVQWNAPRYYGWFSYDMNEDRFVYNCTPYYQYVTRTHFMPRNELPERYSQPDIVEKIKPLSELLKTPLEEVLQVELGKIRRKIDGNDEIEEEKRAFEYANNIVYQVNRVILSVLSNEVPHLKDLQIDHRPKLEAFWSCGGLEPPPRVKRRRRKAVELEKKYGLKRLEEESDPIESNFQYRGSSMLQLRSVNPIANYADRESTVCLLSEQIPERMRQRNLDYGIRTQLRSATILPGHWPGDVQRSSLLSFHSQHHLVRRMGNKLNLEDSESALDSQAALSSFSRMLAQAYSYGFDQFTDLDYPFSTQCISTDGKNWAFYAYQLNTIGLGKYEYQKNKLQNICWRTDNMPILDDQGNLNESVLEHLIKFYINPPTPIKSPKGENITPYLAEQRLNDVEEDYRRKKTYRNLYDMYSHKYMQPGGRNEYPEIYDWEKIFKIYFNARPFDARRRFFEFPYGFEGFKPYDTPWRMVEPDSMPKALFRYRRILREEQEQKAVEKAKVAEKRKFIKDENAIDSDDENY